MNQYRCAGCYSNAMREKERRTRQLEAERKSRELDTKKKSAPNEKEPPPPNKGCVRDDPALFDQFNQDAQDRLRSGNVPAVRDREAAGTRGVFEIHHVELIKDGSAVYDVGKLRVNTPKNHIKQHREP